MDAKGNLKMTIKDIVEIINGIEEKFPVDKWVINKIHIWPIIRINLFVKFSYAYVVDYPINSKKKCFVNVMHRALRLSLSFSKYFFAYLLDYKKNMKPKKCDAIFLSDGVSFNRVKNYWFDKFCDPFIEYFSKNDISSFLMTSSSHYLIPRFNPSKFIQPYLYLYGIMSKVFSRLIHAEDEQLPDFSIFCKLLESKYSDAGRIDLKIIREEVFKIRMVADFFKKIMRKTEPRVGFVVSYYGIEGFAFDLACRELGIPSVDIQHGIQGDLNLAYCRWHKIPDAGYELLPSIFWCWSDFEANAIKKCMGAFSHRHKPIVGGNLWLNQWLNGNFCFIKHCDRIITEVKETYKHSKHILFTQGMGIKSEYFENMLKVIGNSPDTWFWWIRIHPCELKIKPELKKILRGIGILNYDIDHATELPLYALLRHMDIHVTILSSSVSEAESFGVPSVVTHPVLNECYGGQASSEIVTFAYTPEDILQGIGDQLKKDNIMKIRKRQDEQYPDILKFWVSSIKQGNDANRCFV